MLTTSVLWGGLEYCSCPHRCFGGLGVLYLWASVRCHGTQYCNCYRPVADFGFRLRQSPLRVRSTAKVISGIIVAFEGFETWCREFLSGTT